LNLLWVQHIDVADDDNVHKSDVLVEIDRTISTAERDRIGDGLHPSRPGAAYRRASVLPP
jgi:hypothetical protein